MWNAITRDNMSGGTTPTTPGDSLRLPARRCTLRSSGSFDAPAFNSESRGKGDVCLLPIQHPSIVRMNNVAYLQTM